MPNNGFNNRALILQFGEPEIAMPLDHGILNLPLSKRGNIDAQLDRYKAARAAERHRAQAAGAAAKREAKAEAHIALADLLAAGTVIDQRAAKMGVTRKALVAELESWAKWQPRLVIMARKQWMAEAGAA